MQLTNTVICVMKVGLPNLCVKCSPQPAQIDYLYALNVNTIFKHSCTKYKLYTLCACMYTNIYMCVCVRVVLNDGKNWKSCKKETFVVCFPGRTENFQPSLKTAGL
jgi:hypothetical protein